VDRRVGGFVEGLIDGACLSVVLYRDGFPVHFAFPRSELFVRIEIKDFGVIVVDGRIGVVEKRGHFERPGRLLVGKGYVMRR
jgi:hypothetical protein